MVVVGRLEWVLTQIRRGHRVLVTNSYNGELQRQKLKVLIQPNADEVPYSEMSQCCAFAAVSSLLYLAKSLEEKGVLHIMDRGHRHSSGVSEVCFWMEIRQVKENKEVAMAGEDMEAREDGGCKNRTHVTEDLSGLDGSFSPAGEGGYTDLDVGHASSAMDAAMTSATHDIRNTPLADDMGSVSGTASADNGCEVLAGILVDTEDHGLIDRVSNFSGATGGIDQSSDLNVEGGSLPKKQRILVEM